MRLSFYRLQSWIYLVILQCCGGSMLSPCMRTRVLLWRLSFALANGWKTLPIDNNPSNSICMPFPFWFCQTSRAIFMCFGDSVSFYCNGWMFECCKIPLWPEITTKLAVSLLAATCKWASLFPQGQSSFTVHVVFLEKKDSIWVNCYRVFLSTLKALKGYSVILRVTNAYIIISNNLLAHQ